MHVAILEKFSILWPNTFFVQILLILVALQVNLCELQLPTKRLADFPKVKLDVVMSLSSGIDVKGLSKSSLWIQALRFRQAPQG